MLHKYMMVLVLLTLVVWGMATGRMLAEASATAYDTDLCLTDSECEGLTDEPL